MTARDPPDPLSPVSTPVSTPVSPVGLASVVFGYMRGVTGVTLS